MMNKDSDKTNVWHNEEGGIAWKEENDPGKKIFSCLVRVPIAASISKKNGLAIVFEPTRVLVKQKDTVLLDRELSTAIKTKESSWQIDEVDGKRLLILELATREPGPQAWQCLFQNQPIVVEKEPEDLTPPGQPKFDMDQIMKQRSAEGPHARIKVKGVDEMLAGVELVKLSSKLPASVQENIQELLNQGATEAEVLKLLKDTLGK